MGHVVDGPQFSRAFSKQRRLVDCARLVPLVLVISDGPLSGHTHPLQPEKRVHLPVRAVPPCMALLTRTIAIWAVLVTSGQHSSA